MINTICSDLTNHEIIERELLCPAFQLHAGCACEINKALEGHLNADALICLLQSISLQDRKFDATVTKLFDQFEKHIIEEERDIFSWVRLSNVNLILLGRQMAERIIELNLVEHDTKKPLSVGRKESGTGR